MIDPTPNEKAAVLHGGARAGQYLESIGVTDLRMLASDQWEQFCLCLVGGYTEKMSEFNEVPF